MRFNQKKIMNFLKLQLIFMLFSLVGIFAKLASANPMSEVRFYIYYSIEIFILGVYAVLWQKIIKDFSVVVAYANKGVVVIWMLLWSSLLFGESIKMNNILGSVIIILGIGVVALDEK